MAKSKKRTQTVEEKFIDVNKRKCIGCTACGMACTGITNISVLRSVNDMRRSIDTKKPSFEESGCIYCGQCTLICPTDAIEVRNDIKKVNEAIADGKYMIAISSPAVKAMLGEEFNLPIGSDVEGKVQASARKLGFQRVFDSDFGGDMTSIEEAQELIKRMKIEENLPMFTSACPSWVRWVELFKPDMIEHLSTSKSPQQMMGTAIKTYYADTFKILPKSIFILSIEPCTSKKYEAEKEEMGRDGYRDIDAVLTVREYAQLLRDNSIDINAMASEKSDEYMGQYSGSGTIFSYSGGNLRAVLREVSNDMEEIKVDYSKLQPINGLDNSVHGIAKIGSMEIRIAIINTIKDVERFLSKDGWKEYDFVEVTVCPGGCINGGGSPKTIKKAVIKNNSCISCGTCVEKCPSYAIQIKANKCAEVAPDKCIGCTLCQDICRTKAINITTYDKNGEDVVENYIELRKRVIDNIDERSHMRCSDDNGEVKVMYRDYMMEPYGNKAKSLLHESYRDRSSELKSKETKERNRRSR
ncbi:[Fe-Fe] hydrogenase large subunit C-terminal domain-containing protein [Clostridium cadaveris]|uniref:[Fe-Fe] hydrogenase large subunit C-terminal domain-containing protein n=1 Tax=Clostridium cadaveris TaxID=1529 RepID=UPI003996146A